MIRDGLLAFGLLLSTATQLRVPGLPLGPGETLLLAWMVVASAKMMLASAPPLRPASWRLLIFWAVFTVAQMVGLFVGLAIEDFRDNAGAVHTGMAYVLVAALSVLVVLQPGWRLRRTVWIVIAAGAAAVIVLMAAGYGLAPAPGLHLWFYQRFIGWSLNPNQFGLLCTALVLLSLHLFETAARSRAKHFALACMVPAFVGGVITRSDSFVLAILTAGPLFLGAKLLTSVFAAQRRPSFATMMACLMFFSIPALIASAAPFAPIVMQNARLLAIETMDQNDQAADRFQLWGEATKIGLSSAMLGLGPGPHLVGHRRWKFPPPDKGEAHNTVLDLFTQGGILASLSFLWITAAAFLAALRVRAIALASLVLSLFVFSNFHLVARHPVFWFSIALCLVIADAFARAVRPEWLRHADADRPLRSLRGLSRLAARSTNGSHRF